jgi:hypothetical protein
MCDLPMGAISAARRFGTPPSHEHEGLLARAPGSSRGAAAGGAAVA